MLRAHRTERARGLRVVACRHVCCPLGKERERERDNEGWKVTHTHTHIGMRGYLEILIASDHRRVETPAIRRDSYAPEMPDAPSLRYRGDKSFPARAAARSLQMFVEIASRMGGRGVEHETRHDVTVSARGEEVCYLPFGPFRAECDPCICMRVHACTCVYAFIRGVLSVMRAIGFRLRQVSVSAAGLSRIPPVNRLAVALASRRARFLSERRDETGRARNKEIRHHVSINKVEAHKSRPSFFEFSQPRC